VPELLFEPAADDAMRQLEQDPSRARLLERVDAALAALEASPGDARCRRRSCQPVGEMWGMTIRSGDVDWLVIWKYGPGEGQVTVRYIGPDL
jgi:hypothetical protein